MQIFERKVESYKKLMESLDSTVESVRVKEILHLLTGHTERNDTNVFCKRVSVPL